MKVKELIEELREMDPEMEIILQKDSEGTGYSPLACFGLGYYIPDSTYSGDVYDEDWTASDCCLEEDEWEELKAENPLALILAPTN